MSDLYAEIINPNERAPGYISLKEDCIKCGNCSKKLLNIMKVSTSNIKNYYIVLCPYCGDKSFKYLIEGKICVAPADNLIIVRADCDINDNIITNIMELKKC